jgi:acylphosphatase
VAGTVRLDATVSGRVQGVGFRFFVLREANDLSLTGWVANEHDGTVRTVAEGPEASIDRFEEAIRSGPPGAVVENLAAVRLPATGTFEGFTVRPAGHGGD